MMEQEVMSLSSEAKTSDADSETRQQSSDILDSSKFDLKLDKSNILMLGPTGSGDCSVFIVRLSPFLWHYVLHLSVRVCVCVDPECLCAHSLVEVVFSQFA